MKKLIIFSLIALFAFVAFAGDKVTANLGTLVVSTNATAVTADAVVKGEVAEIRIVSNKSTNSCNIKIELADGTDIYANTNLVGSLTFRPMVAAANAANAAALQVVDAGSNTNAVYVPLFLYDVVTVTAHTPQVSNTVVSVQFLTK